MGKKETAARAGQPLSQPTADSSPYTGEPIAAARAETTPQALRASSLCTGEQRTESLPQSAALTAPSSEGAKDEAAGRCGHRPLRSGETHSVGCADRSPGGEAKDGERLRRNAPPTGEKELRRLNGLFQAYIFKNAAGDVWTSCCGQHRNYLRKELTAAEEAVWNARHIPQEKWRWGRLENEPESKRREKCPYCGAEAKVKELRYSGSRKNLWEYRRCVLLRQWRGALWAVAYDLKKSYTVQNDSAWFGKVMTALPEYDILGIYRFKLGKAESVTKEYWNSRAPRNYAKQTAPGKGREMWQIHAPYGCCAEYGMRYEIVGTEEIAKSSFRYCVTDDLAKLCDPIRLLTAACFYPRQLEWLHKLGFDEAIYDLVDRRVKNHPAIRWDAETPRDFMGLSVRELTLIGRSSAPMKVLRLYKKLSQPRTMEEIPACSRFAELLYHENDMRELWTKTVGRGMKLNRAIDYLKREKKKKQTMQNIGQIWLDYLRAAEKVGLDLTNPIFLAPKGLNEKHDQVTEAAAALQDLKKLKEYQKRLKKLARRYTYGNGEFLIRPPIGANEIKAEGKVLHHCVGGYAERHLSGATTILFLRRISDPKKPLATIEMSGNKIIQIHGRDNERTPCADNPNRVSCRTLYKSIIEPWEEWLKGGSKRDKRGLPRKNRKLQEEKTA